MESAVRLRSLGFRLVVLLAAVTLTACSDAATAGGTSGEGDILADGAGADAGGDAASGADARGDAAGDAAVGDAQVEDVGEPGPVCPPGALGCLDGERFTCSEDGATFDLEPCGAGTVCVDGACVQCATNADCAVGEACADGVCESAPVQIVTTALPPALEGAFYAAQLQATDGVPPYAWSVVAGALPAGIELVGSDGTLGGASAAVGTHEVTVAVDDAQGGHDERTLSLVVLESGLHIATGSPLPLGHEGEPYAVTLEALGGTAPYFWGVSGGTLPPGLTLTSGGVIQGTPGADGTFELDVKVFDDGNPPLTDEAHFELPIALAPLEIVGAQQVDLFVTKLIVLPLIVVVDGVPVPYSAQLQAKGGKKPYHWAEEPMPGLVSGFLPNAGLPQGLTLADDGSISGGVSDPSLVVTVNIPVVNITLSGFFFAAKVTDSQPVPSSASAVYIIPTVPVGP